VNRLRVRCHDSVRALLSTHPGVELIDGPAAHPIEFEVNGWNRSVGMGSREGFRGLVELLDNNPLVCADTFSVPDVGGTLALVALGPLIRAGLILEPPAILASFELDEDGVSDALATEGWTGGILPHSEHQPTGSVVALNAMALVRLDGDLDQLDELYDEVYGRSFFVRHVEDGEWDVDLVEGKPWAAYRLRVSPGEGQALLTVQTMADIDGKVGAAQLVHAMNVMAGFEESLGIA